MSKAHAPRGIKQPLVERTIRQRTSRHGEPQKMRKRSVKMVNNKATVVIEWVPVPADGYTRKLARSSTNDYGKRQNSVTRPSQPSKGGKK